MSFGTWLSRSRARRSALMRSVGRWPHDDGQKLLLWTSKMTLSTGQARRVSIRETGARASPPALPDWDYRGQQRSVFRTERERERLLDPRDLVVAESASQIRPRGASARPLR
jgi:hypothetical protein